MSYLRFAHVHYAYSNPKSLILTLDFSCLCSHAKQHTITCYRYGRIFAECVRCARRQMLELNRRTILMFFSIHAPTRVPDATTFLDLWEQEFP